MVEGVLPGSFKETVEEMYRLNGLPHVKFPDYTPPPNIDKDQVQEEMEKMRKAFAKAQKEETTEDREDQMEEETTKKRMITPPQEQRQAKSKREEAEPIPEPEEENIEQATALVPIQIGSTESLQLDFPSTRPKMVQVEQPQSKADPRTVARKTAETYEKHVQQMKFCFIKLKETTVRRKEDPREISRLLKEGRLKYVYTNAEYSEADCRAAWEKGYVNLRNVELKTVTRDFYNEVEYNGKLIERRTSITGTLRKK